MHFPEKDKIFLELTKLLPNPTKIVVGVSGGPDSRFLFELLNNFYISKGRDNQLLIVAHYHHGQRKESDKELQQIFKRYTNHHVYYNDDKPKKGQKETALRSLRMAFFQEVYEKEKSTHIATGHNLDDRIETSFMNLLRGSSLNGLSNMTFCDYRKGVFHLRPIIGLQKQYIQELCDTNNIQYFLDPTNKDSSLTIRNALRNDIFPQMNLLSPQSKWYESWALIYSQIEKKVLSKNSDQVRLLPIHTHRRQGALYSYEIRLSPSNKNNHFTDTDRVYILQNLGIYKHISQKTLAERTRFSNTSGDGYKLLAGVYFFASHGKIYAVKGKEEFRKYENDIQESIVKGKKYIRFDDSRIKIKDEWIGGIIRYSKPGDSYKGKRAKKRMINQKIPLFRRNFVPVVEKKGIIIDVVKSVVPGFYLQSQ